MSNTHEVGSSKFGALSISTTFDMNNNRITNASTNTSDNTAITKGEVDNLSAGVNTKDACLYGSISNITDFSTKATVEAALDPVSASAPILVDGDRVLVKSQTTTSQNGIYSWDNTGGSLVRATDADGAPANEVAGGNYTIVINGDTLEGTGWQIIGTGNKNVGTDPIVWTQVRKGDTSHTNYTDIGTNTHAQIDTHIVDSTIHFLQSTIDHTNITNVGTNTHAQITSHIASTSNPHTVTIEQVSPLTTKGDIIVETGSTATRLAVGTNDQILTAASGQTEGVNWTDVSFNPTSTYVFPQYVDMDGYYNNDSVQDKISFCATSYDKQWAAHEVSGGTTTQPYVGFYKRTDNYFELVSTLQMTSDGQTDHLYAMNSDGTVFVKNTRFSNSVQIYNRSGDTFSFDESFTIGSSISTWSVSFSDTGNERLLIQSNPGASNLQIHLYENVAGTWTFRTTLSSVNPNRYTWNRNDRMLVTAATTVYEYAVNASSINTTALQSWTLPSGNPKNDSAPAISTDANWAAIVSTANILYVYNKSGTFSLHSSYNFGSVLSWTTADIYTTFNENNDALMIYGTRATGFRQLARITLSGATWTAVDVMNVQGIPFLTIDTNLGTLPMNTATLPNTEDPWETLLIPADAQKNGGDYNRGQFYISRPNSAGYYVKPKVDSSIFYGDLTSAPEFMVDANGRLYKYNGNSAPASSDRVVSYSGGGGGIGITSFYAENNSVSGSTSSQDFSRNDSDNPFVTLVFSLPKTISNLYMRAWARFSDTSLSGDRGQFEIQESGTRLVTQETEYSSWIADGTDPLCTEFYRLTNVSSGSHTYELRWRTAPYDGGTLNNISFAGIYVWYAE